MANIKTILELDNSKYLAGINAASAATKAFASGVGQQATNVSKSFNDMGISAGKVAAAFAAAAGFAGKYADEMAKFAKVHDMATTEMLAFGRALKDNGGETESVGKMMQTLANNVTQAAEGNLKLYSTFASLGVSMKDIGSASEKEIRDKLIKSIAAIEDPATRAAKAVEVFGKAAMGVDFTALSKAIDENTAKYGPHEAALNSAANAFGNMEAILQDLKIAFSVAFKPFFDVVGQLKIDINDAATAMKVFGGALSLVVSATAVAGAWKLVAAFQALRVAVVTNPIGAVASILLTAGAALGLFSVATNVATGAIDNNTGSLDKNTNALGKNLKIKRDTSSLLINLEKERLTLTKITDAYKLQNENILKKIDLQFKMLALTDDQKTIAQQVADIEMSRDKALIDLKNQYNSLDADGRARTLASYQEQQKIIKENAELEIKTVTTKLEQQQKFLNFLRSQQGESMASTTAMVERFNNAVKFGLANAPVNASFADIIEKQQKAIQLERIRAELMSASTKVSELERSNAVDIITEITTKLPLLNQDYQQISKSVIDYIKAQAELGLISKETADTLLDSTGMQIVSLGSLTEATARQLKAQEGYQRSFTAGWSNAFRSYVDDATNAAKQAERLFSKFTSGIEDALVNFAKTGKLNWKQFVADMAEELLRSQIKQSIAGLATSFTSAFKGSGGILGGIADLFGGLGGGDKPTGTKANPLYVYDLTTAGGAGGGLTNLFGTGQYSDASGGMDAAKSTKGIMSSISESISGLGDSLGNMIGSIGSSFSGIGSVVGNLLSSITSGGGGGGGIGGFLSSIGDSIGSFFSGLFANGGSIPAGKFGIVGEAGPELVNGPATVTPMRGMGTNVTYNINAVDAMSFKQLVAADPGFIHAVAQAGARTMPATRR